MSRLMRLWVFKELVFEWAVNDVFFLKKYNGIRLMTKFKAGGHVTETDSHPMEDVQNVLDSLLSKGVDSTFNLKDGF